jgi:hypothetical protein
MWYTQVTFTKTNTERYENEVHKYFSFFTIHLTQTLHSKREVYLDKGAPIKKVMVDFNKELYWQSWLVSSVSVLINFTWTVYPSSHCIFCLAICILLVDDVQTGTTNNKRTCRKHEFVISFSALQQNGNKLLLLVMHSFASW